MGAARSLGSRGGSVRFALAITGPLSSSNLLELSTFDVRSLHWTLLPVTLRGSAISFGKSRSIACLRVKEDRMDELRFSRSRALLGIRTEDPPFRR